MYRPWYSQEEKNRAKTDPYIWWYYDEEKDELIFKKDKEDTAMIINQQAVTYTINKLKRKDGKSLERIQFETEMRYFTEDIYENPGNGDFLDECWKIYQKEKEKLEKESK